MTSRKYSARFYEEQLPLVINGQTYYVDVEAEAHCDEETGSWEEPPSADFEVVEIEATWYIKDKTGELIEVKPTKDMDNTLEDFLYETENWSFENASDPPYDYDPNYYP
jgi:hypothetical protein